MQRARSWPRTGPIGLEIRGLLATAFYWFAALLSKWNRFVEHDPIESGRLYRLFTIWLLPEVFVLPATVGAMAGRGVRGRRRGDRTGRYLTGAGMWNPALAGWTYAGDLPVWGALAVSFPVAVVTRSPGCELDALPWLVAGRRGKAAPRPSCAVGLDRLDAWEAARRR